MTEINSSQKSFYPFETEYDAVIVSHQEQIAVHKLAIKRLYKLKKQTLRLQQLALKGKVKRVKKDGWKPSGFAQPSYVSKALCDLLNIDSTVQHVRMDVTAKITAYVRENSLQQEENKRLINLQKPGGKALEKVLGPIVDKDNVKCQLSYFNLQRYLAPHMIKNPPDVVMPKSERSERSTVKKPKTTGNTLVV